jgi:hypothetical protein
MAAVWVVLVAQGNRPRANLDLLFCCAVAHLSFHETRIVQFAVGALALFTCTLATTAVLSGLSFQLPCH